MAALRRRLLADGARRRLHGAVRLSDRHVINQAYVNRNLAGIITLGFVTVALFAVKGLATYGHSVMLSRIGNRIVADNQRAVFDKLLNEGLGFFSDRHSTEFIARLTAGAAAATQVLNLLITSVGRDLFSLIGLVIVMVVQDPVMSFFGFVVAPPAFFVLRKLIRRIYSIARTQFHGGTRMIETLQETLQGIRIVKAFTLEDVMRERFDRNVADVEHEANKMARVSNRASPLMETLGGFAIAHRHHLWRLSRDRDRRDAGRVLLLHHRVPARLRAGQAAGAAQHRAQQRAGRRAHAVRGDRQPAERAASTTSKPALRVDDAAHRIRRRATSPIAATSRCCAACRSSPSPAS